MMCSVGVGAEGRRRWAIFCGSVVSAVENPSAHLFRALGRALSQRGDEATFYEEQSNAAIRALLMREGARAFERFRSDFPEIVYRTADRRTGADLVEWLTRILATVDIAVVDVGAPPTLTAWVGRLTRPHLTTFLVDPGWNAVLRPADIEARDPATFSAIYAGQRDAAAHWREVVPSARVHLFGPPPLPDPAEIPALDSIAARERYQSAADDLLERIQTLLAATR